MDDAQEPMTEDEAEAVLLGLGPPLEWESGIWDGDQEACFGDTTYAVEKCPDDDPNHGLYEVWVTIGSVMTRRAVSPSLSNAKAACEVHAVTGVFPPSMEINPAE